MTAGAVASKSKHLRVLASSPGVSHDVGTVRVHVSGAVGADGFCHLSYACNNAELRVVLVMVRPAAVCPAVFANTKYPHELLSDDDGATCVA